MTTLHVTRGINFWSRRPVTRMDLVVGAYDEISSADVPWFTDTLVRALPGLVEHQCSIGERGGFVLRLRRGTYAPHIVEHVALELQTMIGHDVGYGRTRGGDLPGMYTLVFEHLHEQVGLRAAALALEIVQRAFAGTLDSVDAAVAELRALAAMPAAAPVRGRVLGGVTGGSGRADAVDLLEGRGTRDAWWRQGGTARHEAACDADRSPAPRVPRPASCVPPIVDLSPAYLLQAGLPYSCSRFAIVLDTLITDVPARYRELEHARRLLSIVADAVEEGGFVMCPAKEWEIQDYARERGCRVAVFATDDDITRRDLKCASAMALVHDGRILAEHGGEPRDAGPLRDDVPAASQVAAALAAELLHDDDIAAAAAHRA